jgi:fumarate hydratase class II
MHIAAGPELTDHWLPRAERLTEAIHGKSRAWQAVLKIAWIRREDTLPLAVGQEWSGFLMACRQPGHSG